MSVDGDGHPSPSQGLRRFFTDRTQDSTSSSGSRKSRRSNQVVVFIRSEENVCLKDRDEVKPVERNALAIQPLKRRSWKGNQKVYIPGSGKHKEYAGTIELDTLSRFFKFRRLIGEVNELYVFERSWTKSDPILSAAPAA